MSDQWSVFVLIVCNLGLEVWRQYFSRFRKQLAEVAFCHDLDQEFIGLLTSLSIDSLQRIHKTMALIALMD